MGMDEEQLKRVLELINIAERPIIYAGQGVRNFKPTLDDIISRFDRPLTLIFCF